MLNRTIGYPALADPRDHVLFGDIVGGAGKIAVFVEGTFAPRGNFFRYSSPLLRLHPLIAEVESMRVVHRHANLVVRPGRFRDIENIGKNHRMADTPVVALLGFAF